jgi:hypothetical protein
MKFIKGFENEYSITQTGQVYSHKIQSFLSISYDENGYAKVSFYSNGQTYTKKIHRLVAETFIPNPDNLPCVNHKDQNKANNDISNLEWCDYAYNNNYGDRIEQIREKLINKETISKKVKATHKTTGEILIFPSVREGARFMGNVNKSSNIQACLAGRQKSAYGYIWERIEEGE